MKHFFIFLATVLFTVTTFAQVGMGTTTPDPSASLDISSVTGGVLLPRLTQFQRDNIVNPPAGLWLWCSNCGINGEMQVFNGTSWTNMLGAPAAGTPQIGDYYQGGIVFYIYEEGHSEYVPGEVHGLIAATSDQSTGIQWQTLDSATVTTGATGTTIGTGETNTTQIISVLGQDSNAAKLCDDSSITFNGVTYTDWFLPSKDELYKMYENIGQLNSLGLGNIANLVNNGYWTSSENSNDAAWIAEWNSNTNSVSQLPSFKGNNNRVRAVRSF